jgi:hypothetical protein
VTTRADPSPGGARAPSSLELVEGVSCESCHGSAERWVRPHSQNAWRTMRDERFSPEFGMRDTESWPSRVETCLPCHVGSRRAEDGRLRDVDHDLIAAGHPALRFDPLRYFQNLPAHWDRTAVETADASLTVYQKHLVGRWKVLEAAARLAEDRVRGPAGVPPTPAPELSEYDCFACHRALQSPDTWVAPRGRADWNPWVTAGLQDDARRALAQSTRLGERVPLSTEERLQTLRQVAHHAAEQAQSVLVEETSDAESVLRTTVGREPPEASWCDAAQWYLSVNAALDDRQAAEPPPEDLTPLRKIAQGLLDRLQFRDGPVMLESPAEYDPADFAKARDAAMQLLGIGETHE